MNYYKASGVTTTEAKERIVNTAEALVVSLPNIYLLPLPQV